MAGMICHQFWTLDTVTGTTMAPTGHEAQSRHRWHQIKHELAPESLSPDSEHLKWISRYLEILLYGKFPTGQGLEEKEANGR